MKKLSLFLLLSVIMLTLIACTPAAEDDSVDNQNNQTSGDKVVDFSFSEENFPVIDGSTATKPLTEALASVLLGKPLDECAVYSNFSGTNYAYFALMNNEADLLIAYEMPEDARRTMNERGIELEFAAIGRDALVFLINKNNPVKNLSQEQIVAIYSGEITNWQAVGGNNEAIKAFQRNATSGSQTLMEKLVMGNTAMVEPPAEYMISEMEGLVTAVAEYNNSGYAIGYNVYYFVSQMNPNEQITLLSVDNVAPTNGTIQDGSYPYINDFYVVIRKDAAEGSPERILFDWLQSSDGQTMIKNAGYVSIN